ncbi:MAG: glycoside hydrolase family 78 protein [Clostridia bacterium]|nr:glycoside hydrolase family 78 protein [Clostridia bacterium]
MKFEEVFGSAKFVGGDNPFSVLRGHFQISNPKGTVLRAVGLGFFTCYINGKLVSEDRFLPLATDYEKRDDYPKDEILTGHRLYVPEYDITSLVRPGDNVIALYFGGGWYTLQSPMYTENCRYGYAKAAYRITTEDGEFVSSENDRIADGYVTEYQLQTTERQDRRNFDPAVFGCDFDDSSLPHAEVKPTPDTEYLFTDCPADRIDRRMTPKFIGEKNGVKVYDSGCNCSAVPVLKLGSDGACKVFFSEELTADGMPDPANNFGQEFHALGKEGDLVSPEFTWFGFRYFSVAGDAVPTEVDFVHSNLRVTSDFRCDNEILQWFYQTYLNTELSNMHAGIPSDCPHIERQGYTGDGELTCLSAMTTMDVKAFYLKWIYDIIDCQDTLTGHVQYTAPYFKCGGGPGAWGCAICEVPYQFFKQYGIDEPARDAYAGMKRYFDYLEAHSKNGLVVSDKEGEWCLGDWCTTMQVVLPAPFVNNYYYIKALNRAKFFATRFGFTDDVELFDRRIKERKEALTAAYFNTWDENFLGCVQGANAFMVDIGLGTERTYRNLVDYYRKLGSLDTGICGTEVVMRVLCEHGDRDLAFDILTSEKDEAVGGWMRAGATSFWEFYRNSTDDRSHNHPMFGSPITDIFEYLLGIRDGSEAGFSSLLINPYLPQKLGFAEGVREIPAGKVRVRLSRNGQKTDISVSLPEGVGAVLDFGGKTYALSSGENSYSL